MFVNLIGSSTTNLDEWILEGVGKLVTKGASRISEWLIRVPIGLVALPLAFGVASKQWSMSLHLLEGQPQYRVQFDGFLESTQEHPRSSVYNPNILRVKEPSPCGVLVPKSIWVTDSPQTTNHCRICFLGGDIIVKPLANPSKSNSNFSLGFFISSSNIGEDTEDI